MALSLLPTESNPIFLAVMVIVLLDIASLLCAWRLRAMARHGIKGICGKPPIPSPSEVHPVPPGAASMTALRAATRMMVATGTAPGGGADGERRLVASGGAEATSVQLPKLATRFEVKAELLTFDESAFIRRLAVLVGVDPANIGATLSAGSSEGTILMDVEIRCPDATTLVMGAKTLKKAAAKLSVALGVTFVREPQVTVPEPPRTEQGDVAWQAMPRTAAHQLPSAAGAGAGYVGQPATTDLMRPTIQERIPSVAHRTRTARRLLTGEALHADCVGLTRALSKPSSAESLKPLTAASLAAAPDAASLAATAMRGGGIQERISLSGLGARNAGARRGTSSLRGRAAGPPAGGEPTLGVVPGSGGDGPSAGNSPTGGAPAPANLLSGLNLTPAEVNATSGADAPQPLPTGIQERLPAMPGMRRRGLRSVDSVGRALSAFPPPAAPPRDLLGGVLEAGADGAPGAAPGYNGALPPPRQTIQERVPRVGGAPPAAAPRGGPASPPPSPPAAILPNNPASPSAGAALDGAIKPRSLRDVFGGASAHDMRLQTHPRVAPPQPSTPPPKADSAEGAPPPPKGIDETWDDRSRREIVIGAAREHTLIGFVSAILFGDEPKLPTIAQATQLLWGTLLGLLFLCCAQLRYEWLGARWATPPPPSAALMQRLSHVSMVALGAAPVNFAGLVCARVLFLVANRTRTSATPGQSCLIYCSAWSIVMLTCGALAIGAINMGDNMDARVVNEDVLVSWGLAAGVHWLLIEPIALMLLCGLGLLLKWCTSFEGLMPPEGKDGRTGTSSTGSEKGGGAPEQGATDLASAPPRSPTAWPSITMKDVDKSKLA